MSYGFEINNRSGQTIITESDTTFSYYGKYRFSAWDAGGAYIFPIPVKVTVPICVFIKNDWGYTSSHSTRSIGGVITYPETIGATNKGHYYQAAFSNTPSDPYGPPLRDPITVYVFVPTMYLQNKGHGLGLYNSKKQLVFGGDRPPLMMAKIKHVDCWWSGGNVTSNANKINYSHNVAVASNVAGEKRPGNQQYRWEFLAGGKCTYLYLQRWTNTSTWPTPEYARDVTLSVINTDIYDRFDNLTYLK